MRFTYRLVEERRHFIAQCNESDAEGEGRTEAEAIASLRTALEERMFRPDAVAPPSQPQKARIELVRSPDASPEPPDADGPGDTPRADSTPR